jgi:LmbE family N-acetylglucosaminyl deacetylase
MRIRSGSPSSRGLAAIGIGLLVVASAMAQAPADVAPKSQSPDDRFKVDLLLVVAHPDDESAVGPYLARAVFDEGRRVAVVFTTSGEGGRNAVGVERGASMAAVRQIEARRALAEYGVDQVWFFDGRDTATQNVLLSLSNWPHGDVLEDTIRVIRLTRPDVVVTWIPKVVAGENHGDHQAAAVVATEAFDLAGDPTVFPGQLAPPRLRFPPENLLPWQPKKLYYATDAYDSGFMEAKGPAYDRTAVSKSRNVPYAYLAMRSARHHLSQFHAAFPKPLLDALERNDVAEAMRLAAERPGRRSNLTRLLLAKSHVPGSPGGDVFEGVSPGAIAFVAVARPAPVADSGLTLKLDGSWRFYEQFWRAHGLERVLSAEPYDVSVRPGLELRVPLVLRNVTGRATEVTLARTTPLPAGWVETPMPTRYPLGGDDTYRVEAVLTTPATETPEPVALTYEARTAEGVVGAVTLRVVVRLGSMPQ